MSLDYSISCQELHNWGMGGKSLVLTSGPVILIASEARPHNYTTNYREIKLRRQVLEKGAGR